MSRTKAAVYLDLKVRVYVDNWDTSASFDSLLQQAEREGRNRLIRVLGKNNIDVLGEPGAMQVVLTREK